MGLDFDGSGVAEVVTSKQGERTQKEDVQLLDKIPSTISSWNGWPARAATFSNVL